MAIFIRAKDYLFSRFKSLTTSLPTRFNRSLDDGWLRTQCPPKIDSDYVAQLRDVVDMSKWKKLNSRYYGITNSMIPHSPWTVLKILRNVGFEAYLVGGCVRDLLLHRAPKDFDVITTANLEQIQKQFHRCHIVGQRFPICKVYIKGSAVEVSSFETVARHAEEKEKVLVSQMPSGCDDKDFILWRNSMHRDFTINSLFFDPFTNQIYDYADGMADLRSLKLRTLIPAQLSFQEDCARILRGLRIAGRLGLTFCEDTETAISKLSSSVLGLDKFRLMMELNYMLSYGAAGSSLFLLQRFNLLEKFLPFHAAYLDQHVGEKSGQNPMMLMKLLFHLDKLVSCDRPCDCSLWVGLLAFHQALVINPQDAFVIWAFASVLCHGKWEEGVKFARENAAMQVKFIPEISGFSEFKSDKELAEEVSRLATLVQESVGALIDADGLSKSMSQYPFSPCSGLVFLPQQIGKSVAQLFDVLVTDVESYDNRRESSVIDYYLLGRGNPHENRFALGKVILQTLSNGLVDIRMKVVKDDPEFIEENCDSKLSDLVNNKLLVEKDKKRVVVPLHHEPIQKVTEKQTSIKMYCFTKHEEAIKKEKFVLKNYSQAMGKKCWETAETSHLPVKNKPDIKKDCHLLSREMVKKIEKPKQALVKEMDDVQHVIIAIEKCQDRPKKHTTTVEKVKHHVLPDKETEQQFDVFKNCNLSPDAKTKLEKETQIFELELVPNKAIVEGSLPADIKRIILTEESQKGNSETTYTVLEPLPSELSPPSVKSEKHKPKKGKRAEVDDKKPAIVANAECQDTKKVKHHMLPDKETEQQFGVFRKFNFSPVGKNKMEKKKDVNLLLNIKKTDKQALKEKSDCPSLSRLFRS